MNLESRNMTPESSIKYNALRITLEFRQEFGTYTIFFWGKPFKKSAFYPESVVDQQSKDLVQFYNSNGMGLQLLNQVHGDHIVSNLTGPENIEPEADAIFSVQASQAVAVKTADCIPILFFNRKSPVFGAIHSGWKGLQSEIFSRTMEKLSELNSGNFNDYYFIVGPHIKTQNYETSDDVYSKFKPVYSEPLGTSVKRNLNMARILSDQMNDWKIPQERIIWMNDNTFHSDQFFSHRSGDAGRNFNIISFSIK